MLGLVKLHALGLCAPPARLPKRPTPDVCVGRPLVVGFRFDGLCRLSQTGYRWRGLSMSIGCIRTQPSALLDG
jgi:hypothetical protein